jgi:hypothetical protein
MMAVTVETCTAVSEPSAMDFEIAGEVRDIDRTAI